MTGDSPHDDETVVASVPPAVDEDASSADAPQKKRKKGGSFLKELPFLIVIALVLALLIKTFLVQAFYIPSASMENTLQGGDPRTQHSSPGHPYDRVLVNKLVYDFRDVHRGEIVVFKRPPNWPNESEFTEPTNPVVRFFHNIASAVGFAPSGGSDFIKRVIAIPGDTVSCQNDVLRVNGVALHENYLFPGAHPCSGDGFEGQSRHIGKGQLWVMGDNRDDSSDSRQNGPVPEKNVIGRAFWVIWPVSDWRTLGVPTTFHQKGIAAAAGAVTPFGMGLVGAVPIVGVRRVVRRRRARRRAL